MTKLHELAKLGQSVWYDNISRQLLNSGGVEALIAKGVRGMTSNPTIFEKAINGSSDYDADLQRLMQEGKTPLQIFEGLAMDDIRRAADLLRPIYDESKGLDGYVSLEVNPDLAHNTEGTIEAATRYFTTLGRPNIMIKIPATPAGIPAIEACISKGININITLMFSLKHYEDVTEAYISGLEKYAAAGGDVSKVASVASFFVSRVDTKVDKLLAEKGAPDLQGKIAIANAKVTYARFKEIFSTARWKALEAKGARVQRPLWASTSTKNPAYSPTIYVDTLIGPHTVNTMPPETIDAFLERGTVAVTVEDHLDEAQAQLARLEKLGIDFAAVTEELQAEGVQKFSASFADLLNSIAQKVPA